MRKVLIAAALVLTASLGDGRAVLASEPPKSAVTTTPYVDITTVALPIVADGRLLNYVFVQVRLNLTPAADAQKMREREPYFRDALVRAAHRTSFTSKTDYMHVDEQALKVAITREVVPLLGTRNVASVQILSQQPKQRVGLPRPPA